MSQKVNGLSSLDRPSSEGEKDQPDEGSLDGVLVGGGAAQHRLNVVEALRGDRLKDVPANPDTPLSNSLGFF